MSVKHHSVGALLAYNITIPEAFYKAKRWLII